MRKASAQGVLFGQAVAQRLGINPSDLECLDLVVMSGGVTAGQLAEATGLTTGAITGVVDRLEAGGFVMRDRDSVDRRKIYVRAVPTKTRGANPFYGPLEEAFNAMMQSYTEEQLELLVEFLTRSHELMVRQTTRVSEMPKTSPARKRRL
jgi:DNA-binding MarR family transcriptional regulator